MNLTRGTLCLALLIFPGIPAIAPATQEIDVPSQVVVTTSMGSSALSFFRDKVPFHVRLFLSRVAAGAYDGTSFGYVVKWGLIQGGARLPRSAGQELAPDPVVLGDVRAETSDLKHCRGAILLMLDQSDSCSGQFFICVTPQPGLDGRYTPIGNVAEGIEVVDKISEIEADARGMPVERPRIEKARLRPARPIPPPAYTDTAAAELAQHRAVLDTALGTITLEFFPDLASRH